jgi:hypothetical protein
VVKSRKYGNNTRISESLKMVDLIVERLIAIEDEFCWKDFSNLSFVLQR